MSHDPQTHYLPYAYTGPHGCGGFIKVMPDDFFVEEIPAYLPSGNGEHIYIFIEKKGVSTATITNQIAKIFKVPTNSIGHAGLKDTQAITRQWISIHTSNPVKEEKLLIENVKVLDISRHSNKLRPGHLFGNKFDVMIRDVKISKHFDQLLRFIQDIGFPNYFGIQRLGNAGRTANFGKKHVKSGFQSTGSLNQIRFETNAYQSAIFNAIIAHRISEFGFLDKFLPGDIACLHQSAGFFSVDPSNIIEANDRAIQGEISPSGLLPGFKTLIAKGIPGQWENNILEKENLTLNSFKARGKRYSPKGERRPVRQRPMNFESEPVLMDDTLCLRLRFVLPSGTYATSLLREIMKNDDQPFPFPEILPLHLKS